MATSFGAGIRSRTFARNRRQSWIFATALFAALLAGCENSTPTDLGSPTDPGDPLTPSEATWNRVLENVVIEGDVVVPAGETWLIGPNVSIAGNLRTDSGTIAMRPGSSLKFVGADPDKYVGGGMGYEPQFANDIGLWIGHMGVLDIQGTPKTGWNRTGEDPTWNADDEYWIAPTQPGDYEPKPWSPGDPIPQIDPRVPAAEVANVTRDILIEGPGHIHIHSSMPQRIEYVTLRNMGVSNLAHEGPVLGRYALHIHHGGDGTRGTVIRGVASIGSGGRVFVPHESNGITLEDVVAVNSRGEAFWWDIGDRSVDITVDRFAAIGLSQSREVTGGTPQFDGLITLGGGRNITIRNSVATGGRGAIGDHGFNWPSGSDNNGVAMWKFSEGNVAHNNDGSGVRLWFNNADSHIVEGLITYRNGGAGIENGAYRNSHIYRDNLLIEDHLTNHASAKPNRDDEGPLRFQRITVDVSSSGGAALTFGVFNLAPLMPTEYSDCDFRPGPGAPTVSWDTEKAANPLKATFTNCNLSPDDFEFVGPFPETIAGSRIVIDNEGEDDWEITLDLTNRTKIVRSLP